MDAALVCGWNGVESEVTALLGCRSANGLGDHCGFDWRDYRWGTDEVQYHTRMRRHENRRQRERLKIENSIRSRSEMVTDDVDELTTDDTKQSNIRAKK